MTGYQAIYKLSFLFLYSSGISNTIWVLFLLQSHNSTHHIHIIHFAYMDYIQRHQTVQDVIGPSFDENEDKTLKVPKV